MSMGSCKRQAEVRELLTRGHWPHACPAELRAHLDSCRSCAELVAVTEAFQRSRATAVIEARLPAAGAIWWRAQLRRRNAALERVGRPILGAYLFALTVMLLVAGAAVIEQARHGVRWLDWLPQLELARLHVTSSNASLSLSSGGALLVLLPVFAAVALVGAVVLYLAERH